MTRTVLLPTVPADPQLAAAAILDDIAMQIPVPIDDILTGLSITVGRNHFTAGTHEAGFAWRYVTRPVIGLNTSISPRRQRFVLAHMLGHLLLHRRELIVCYSVLTRSRGSGDGNGLSTLAEESAANQFAAALLLPAPALTTHLATFADDPLIGSRDALIGKIAQIFEVSSEAASWRMINLGLVLA